MLRDILTAIDDVVTWPCDEINYIWRYNNATTATDELGIEDVTTKNRKHIRSQFDQLYRKTGAQFIVEKTCANSLRVNFVNEIIPEARYIFLYRNPVDVVASAKKRWQAPLDIKYILKKARYVPLQDIPYYASKYLWNRIYKFFTKEERLAFWGPQFAGMEELLANNSLEVVAAEQWKKSVEQSFSALEEFEQSNVYGLSYEEFVDNPSQQLEQILNFLRIDLQKKDLQSLVSKVRTTSVNQGYQELDNQSIDRIEKITDGVYERVREKYEA